MIKPESKMSPHYLTTHSFCQAFIFVSSFYLSVSPLFTVMIFIGELKGPLNSCPSGLGEIDRLQGVSAQSCALAKHLYIGIKHVFPCIYIRWVPRVVLKTEGASRGFQHRPRNPANVNARKKHVRSLLLHKSIEKVDFRAVFRCIILALFFYFFTSAHEDNFHLYPRSRAICKQLLNHGGKLARIHHVVAEFTKCSGCLPSILIADNCIFFTFRWQVRLCTGAILSP